MHGWCRCGECSIEWDARNSYWLSDDTPPKHKKPGRKRGKASKKRKPCPDTGGAHVYGWIKRIDYPGYRYNPDYEMVTYTYVCLGCGHIGPKRRWSYSPPPEVVYNTFVGYDYRKHPVNEGWVKRKEWLRRRMIERELWND